MRINDRSKESKMKSNKLFERLDNLDSYAVEDPNEKITINCISIFSKKTSLQVNLSNLPDKSLKIFNVNDIMFGYVYFQDSNCIGSYTKFFDNFNNDSESDKISRISIKYENGDLLTVRVHWNSLIYKLDNDYSILLFMGVLLEGKGI